MSERKPVFYDEEQRRWRRTRRVLKLAGVLFAVVLVTFFITIASAWIFPACFCLPAAPICMRS